MLVNASALGSIIFTPLYGLLSDAAVARRHSTATLCVYGKDCFASSLSIAGLSVAVSGCLAVWLSFRWKGVV